MQVPRKSSRSANNDNCQALSPLVMALFDGEADELQARRARAHLLVCQTCANRWLDWNRSRSLLVSVPPPAPPETLVWRVLRACNLATAGRQISPNLSAQTAPATQTALAPSSLSDQILARTTRSHEVSASRPWSWSRSWPALALPSVALWLLVLQREPLLLSLTMRSQALDVPAPATTLPPRTILPRSAPNRVQLAVRPSSSTPTRNADEPQQNRDFEATGESASALQAAAASAPRTARVVAPDAELARQWQQIQALTANAPRPAAVPAAAVRLVAAPAFASPEFRSLEVSAPPQRRRISPAPRLARLSNETAVPGLRAAGWRTSTSRVSRLIETAAPEMVPSRVSVPRVSIPSVAAPSSARLLAENSEADDDRVDEMRSVVEDFRAALTSEETPPDDEDDEWG